MEKTANSLSFVITAIIACAVCLSGSAAGATFTSPATIAAGDLSYDGQDIVIDGTTVTIDGEHTFNSLIVMNGGVLTHSPESLSGLNLTITTDATVESTSSISATGKGYGPTEGPGAGGSSTLRGGGAGHGGEGAGTAYGSAPGGPSYGSISEPVQPGSGGGNAIGNSQRGGAGGGVIRIAAAGTFTIEGALDANGAPGNNNGSYSAGGGSGGSIWITAGLLIGGGLISANGGSAGVPALAGGGGAGGRIVLDAATDSFTGSVSAAGAVGHAYGGAGTILRRSSLLPAGSLLVDNAGHAGMPTPVQPEGAFDSVTISGEAVAQVLSALAAGSLLVADGGTLSCREGEALPEIVVTGDLTIQAGGAINADGKGHPAATGPGAGGSSSVRAAGAGHGGIGGMANSPATVGGSYGSITNPVELGSGGGTGVSSSAAGGAGGGAVNITVGGTLNVDGSLSANGMPGNTNGSYAGGGGSGGSILLDVGTLQGGGSITANGGQAGVVSTAGGGAGGRIALLYAGNAFTGLVSARGALGFQCGAAGTVYTRSSSQADGDLLIENGSNAGAITPLDPPGSFDSVVIDDGALVHLESPLAANAVRVASAGTLGTWPGDVLPNISVSGDMLIEGDGALDLAGAGYAPATGPGAGSSASVRAAGAGYGGNGGKGDTAGGKAYGSIAEPANLGSGGGNATSANLKGGAGGGAAYLAIAGTLTVNGTLSADGLNGGTNSGYYGGGGSGGSIRIVAGVLAGSGSISADGGDAGGSTAGGGGGGRIAISCSGNTFPGTISAIGGSGLVQGGAGTIYSKTPGQAHGDLLVDNGGTAGEYTPLAWADPFDSVRIAAGGIGLLEDVLTASSLTLATGGTITGNPVVPMPAISVNGDMLIEAGSFVTVGGRGYGPAAGPGAGANSTMKAAGAGHGGTGGSSSTGALGGASYGVARFPIAMGSGGGNPTSYPSVKGGSGGGAVRIAVAGTLTIDGAIVANGLDGSYYGAYQSGGGSGGSILITCTTLAGSGAISANGGNAGESSSGGGAGGRIAIYAALNQMNVSSITVTGGTGYVAGGAGTIHFSRGWYVDDDAPGDPGPGDPLASDPAEDGTQAHPFDSIAEAVAAASDGDIVAVLAGTYRGPGNRDIAPGGKTIRIASLDGPSRCVIDCQGSEADPHRGFSFASGDDGTILEGFTILNGSATQGGGISCSGASPSVSHCIIAGCIADLGGGIYCQDAAASIAHVTITGNTATSAGGGIYCSGSPLPEIINSIIYGNTPCGICGDAPYVTFSDVQGGFAGIGNINVDPLFADPAARDYHLKSFFGRWDPAADSGHGAWVNDAVTSRCIDAADPWSPFINEPKPNLGRANIGAYGNTAEASRSGWPVAGDVNGDCVTNVLDLIVVRNKLGMPPTTGDNWKADVNQDGRINVLDLIVVRNKLGTKCI